MAGRHLCLLGLAAVAAAIFHGPMAVVVGSSILVDQYSQILVVAPISVLLICMQRRKVFANAVYSPVGGALYVAFAAGFVCLARHSAGMDRSNYISLSILLFSGCCIAAFLFCYGSKASQAAAFPLFFLVLMTPLPDAMRERVVSFLQNGSAVATDWFFTAAGIPFRREGVILTLPTVTIEIAKECSGIRSSMVLFLICMVFGYLYLRSGWSRLALLLWLIPLTIIKNAVRIFTLCTLGMYVDRGFLTGRLHHDGGFVFFALAFAGLWAGVWVLQKLEGRMAGVPRPVRAAPPRRA